MGTYLDYSTICGYIPEQRFKFNKIHNESWPNGSEISSGGMIMAAGLRALGATSAWHVLTFVVIFAVSLVLVNLA